MDLGGSSSTEAYQQLNHASTSEMGENSTTLLNLPPICLDHVLKHLNLTDLTNAANSHSALTASAIRVFGVYVKHKPIVLCPPIILHWRAYFLEEVQFAIHFVSDRRLFSSVLNHFGPKLESLNIHIEHRFILNKVTEKCGPNLSKLHVSLARKNLDLNHRFPKLHELVFIDVNSNFQNSWLKINENFPELRCLEIYTGLENSFEFENTLIDHIPNLTRFVFYSHISGWNDELLQLRRIGEFVNANKHINSLRLRAMSYEIDILRASINWEELEITDLYLSGSSYDPFNVQHIGQLRQLRILQIGSVVEHFEILDLNQLEELDIEFNEYQPQTFVNFYTNCNNLRKLTIRTDGSTRITTSFERITNTLPQLKEVTFKILYLASVETEIITGISVLMRQRRSLHSIEVIIRKGTVNWNLIQNENWELQLKLGRYNIETARFQKKIRNA